MRSLSDGVLPSPLLGNPQLDRPVCQEREKKKRCSIDLGRAVQSLPVTVATSLPMEN
jgi:hypothetical protein